MLRRIAVILSALVFGSGILFASVLRTASIKYRFSPRESVLAASEEGKVKVDYQLPYPGRILPDNPFWYLKVARDKIWFLLTSNPERRAELSLLFADKRLAGSKILFERKKTEMGFSTLTKAEKYLEEALREESNARSRGMDTSELLKKLAKASLKHREMTEEILGLAPEDAKPKIVQVQDYSISVYKKTRDALLSKGLDAPKDPFNGN